MKRQTVPCQPSPIFPDAFAPNLPETFTLRRPNRNPVKGSVIGVPLVRAVTGPYGDNLSEDWFSNPYKGPCIHMGSC